MSDEELLAGLPPDEQARMQLALEREAKPVQERGPKHKPTWHELWEAGWVAPPRCRWPFPTEPKLLQALYEEGPGAWVEFVDACECGRYDCNVILQALYQREPKLLRRSVTKQYGIRWRLREGMAA